MAGGDEFDGRLIIDGIKQGQITFPRHTKHITDLFLF